MYKNTKIISAFPGTGKSFLHINFKNLKIKDSDSTNFKWIYQNNNKIVNPDFPNNYIKHIKENIGICDYILVSSHAEVRKILVENNLFFTLVVPHQYCKKEYLTRYKTRGSSEDFIKLIEKNWDEWILDCLEQEGCDLFLLDSGEYLSNVYQKL